MNCNENVDSNQRLNPGDEVVLSSLNCSMHGHRLSLQQREGGTTSPVPLSKLNTQYDPQAASHTPIIATAAEDWIQQSLVMPSSNHETSVSGNGEKRESIGVPKHRREASIEDYAFLWTNSEHDRSNDMGASYTTLPKSFSTGAADSLDVASTTNTSSSSNYGTSHLHDSARITNWEMVGELCLSQPESAAYIGTEGWTALHHACNRRCPDPVVVESLIRAYPKALLTAEKDGWLPLHHACRNKAPKEVVKLLLHMYPDEGRVSVMRPDRKGRLPLYYAVRYSAPKGVEGLLLEMDGSAAYHEDQNGDSPLTVLWDDWAEKLDGKRTIQRILNSPEEIENLDNLNSSIGTIIFDMHAIAADDDGDDGTTGIKDRIENSKMVRKRLEQHQNAFQRLKKVNIFLKAAFGFPLTDDFKLEENAYLKEERQNDTKNPRKWRLLHAILAIKCHFSLFLLALSLYPEQVSELDKKDLRQTEKINGSQDSSESIPSNLTALHLAASSHADGDYGKLALKELLSLYPEAAKCVDTEGNTPLHMISENKFKSDWNLDGAEEVYGANENAIMSMDTNGRVPLHRASSSIVHFNSRIDRETVVSKSMICNLLREHTDAASHSDHFGCLPLHLVVQNGAIWDAQVQALFDANTAAVGVRTGVKLGNRLPLHFAAANVKSKESMFEKLLSYHPAGASQVDRKGLLPLHLACESGHSWDIVRMIHEEFPSAIREAENNKRGWNALHMAAASESSSAELISELVRLYPEAANVRDSANRYPLHLACMSGKGWDDGLSSIYAANASAVRMPDKQGLLPLHMLTLQNWSEPKEELRTIYEILKCDPTVLIH
mmetsp:Transcript_17828/g.40757  ORF Transcript_17828/g.40757 Transcript_17828/m.40757 type:complete len:834 (-) Transcript_17828:792-3293(-)